MIKTVITNYEFDEREADHEEFEFWTDRQIVTTKISEIVDRRDEEDFNF